MLKFVILVGLPLVWWVVWKAFQRTHHLQKDEADAGKVIRHLGPIAESTLGQMIERSAGVELSPVGSGPDMIGEASGWPVRLHYVSARELHVSCDTGGAVPRVFGLGPEGTFQSDDLQAGDAAFDKRIKLKGPDRVVAALVKRDLRPLILRLDERSTLTVERGIVSAILKGDLGGPDRAAWMVRDVVALARGFSMTSDQTPGRLEERVLDQQETDTLRTVALTELELRWPVRLANVEEALIREGHALLSAHATRLRDERLKRQRRESGAGGELAVLDAPAEGALSEVQQGRLSVKKS